MQPMAAGMNVDPNTHIQVLEVKVSQAAVREALLESAVSQLSLEVSQHMMEVERLQNIISPPVEDAEAAEPALEVVSLIGDDDESVIEVTEDASADN